MGRGNREMLVPPRSRRRASSGDHVFPEVPDPVVRHGFLITWNGGKLRYAPSDGYVQDLTAGRLLALPKHPPTEPVGTERVSTSDDPKTKQAFRFEPVCLTVYPTSRCPLACRYCYAGGKEQDTGATIDPESLEPAAQLVAAQCCREGRPFLLGFHGGNEPLLNPPLLSECIETCRRVASAWRIPLRIHGTTSGFISESAATWAAQTFHGISLSWDGSPEVHEAARVLRSGAGTSDVVARTARVFAAADLDLTVRCTVTRSAVDRLPETIVTFRGAGVRHVTCCPVYQNRGRTVPSELIPCPEEFAAQFLIARHWARRHGIRVTYPGSRFGEVHGRFCPILQRNLTVTPDGRITACFLVTDGRNAADLPLIIGTVDQTDAEHAYIDPQRLNRLAAQLGRDEGPCRTCFNARHCAKGCPNHCPVSPPGASSLLDCTLERRIGLADILDFAGYPLEPDPGRIEDFFASVHVSPLT